MYAQNGETIPQGAYFGVLTLLVLLLSTSCLLYCKRFREEAWKVEQHFSAALLWVLFSCFVLSLDTESSVLQRVIMIAIGAPVLVLAYDWLSVRVSCWLITNLEKTKSSRLFTLGVIESLKSIENQQYYRHYVEHVLECRVADCCCREAIGKLSNKSEITQLEYYHIIAQTLAKKLSFQ